MISGVGVRGEGYLACDGTISCRRLRHDMLLHERTVSREGTNRSNTYIPDFVYQGLVNH